VTWELIIGRGIACCLRPIAAWHVLTRAGRTLVIGAYAGVGFVATLIALVLF
jgi:hypothetical protein